MMYWGNHMSTGDWVFSIFGTLIILALIVGVIVWLVSLSSRSDTGPTAAGESARHILDRRLARGGAGAPRHPRPATRRRRDHSRAVPAAPRRARRRSSDLRRATVAGSCGRGRLTPRRR